MSFHLAGGAPTFAPMSTILTGISAYCGEMNIPGLKTLRYLPVDWLDDEEYEEIVTAANNFQKAIVPSLGGDAWLTLPYLPRGDGWQERHRRTDQGPEYAQEISGTIPKLRAAVTGELALMHGHRYLVQLTDKNAKPWLVGRPWEPLEFTADAQTGGTGGGLNSYDFRFQGVTTRRAFGYVPVY